MLGTRPDIAFAVIKMSQQSANPTEDHLQRALYILKYLQGTSNYQLTYEGNSNQSFIAYSDSDWGTDPGNRKSQTGYIIKLANAPVCWVSHQQKTITLSSTEAEYMALSDCARQIRWIQNLFGEIGFPLRSTPLIGDNQGSIYLASNEIQEKRTKHMDIRFHHIRECISEKKIEILYAPTQDNPADLLTKNLTRILFEKCRKALGLLFH